MITPTKDLIDRASSWKELYTSLGLNPRNDRACRKVRDWVVEHFPDTHLNRYARYMVSETDFIEAVQKSKSIRATLLACGLDATGASYATFHKRVADLDLDTSHFTGQGHGSYQPNPPKAVEDYLHLDGPRISSFHLKTRLLKAGLKEHICEICGITEWCGKPTPIALDHKNGNKRDNRLENLRTVCPNCHAQTETFAGKNIGKGKW